jgi:cytochrome c/quinol oxidase subunit I
MEAPALALRGPRAIARAEPAVLGRRIGGLYLLTGLALFALMGVLGLVMRLSQADVYTLPPTWFYRIMTLHGAGMLVGALLAQMGAMWYALRDVVPLHLGRALAAWLAILAGTVLVLVSVLVGGFATGWTFRWPLPLTSAGAYRTVSFAAVLPPVSRAAAGVQCHHIGHSAMFLAGAAFGLALASTSDVWERLTVRLEQSGLVLAIVMPALALLAMSPRLYEGVEDDPALHFAYHLIFLVLGALASLGSAALGRVPAWSLIGLASGMGVLYAAGVVGG